MKNKKTLLLGSLTVVLAIFLAATLWFKKTETTKQMETASKQQSSLERSYSITLGPDDAKVTLVEFLDPECESCRAFYPFVKNLMAKHPNDIRLVVRYAPFHPNSRFAIKVLEAARLQNRYWEVLSTLFYYQPTWGDHHNPNPELIWNYLPETGVDIDQIRKDLENPNTAMIIEQDIMDSKDLGVRATPSFFINGKPLTEFGFNQLQSAIEAEL